MPLPKYPVLLQRLASGLGVVFWGPVASLLGTSALSKVMEGVDNIEQQIEILSKALKSEKARFGRWFVFCCFFAIAVSALAALTNSAWFFAAAGFGWFFVWNRWNTGDY